jgi:hypothetical protein
MPDPDDLKSLVRGLKDEAESEAITRTLERTPVEPEGGRRAASESAIRLCSTRSRNTTSISLNAHASEDSPDPVGDRRVMVCLVLVEASPVGAVIGVLAPTAAGEAVFLPNTAADCTDFQQVGDDMAGDLPPAVEAFKLISDSIQFAITQHRNTPARSLGWVQSRGQGRSPRHTKAIATLQFLCFHCVVVPVRARADSECLCQERLVSLLGSIGPDLQGGVGNKLDQKDSSGEAAFPVHPSVFFGLIRASVVPLHDGPL